MGTAWDAAFMALESGAVQLAGRGRGDTSQKTGLRTRRHHQHHDPGAPDQPERHETPDPVRSNEVEPGFHCVREASGEAQQAPGSTPARAGLASGRHRDYTRPEAGRRTSCVRQACGSRLIVMSNVSCPVIRCAPCCIHALAGLVRHPPR
jgi:hypothetical protein